MAVAAKVSGEKCTTIVFQGRDQDMDVCLAPGLVESILHFDF